MLILTLLLPYKYMVAILLIFCPFMVTGVFHIGGKFVQPYLICELFVILSFLRDEIKDIREKDIYIYISIFLFMCYGLVITIIGPLLFSGIEVVGKNLDSSYYGGYDKLAFSNNNVTQIGYLVLNMMTLVCIFHHRANIDLKFLKKVFLVAVSVSVFMGYWEFISKTTGFIPFPSDLLMSGNEDGLYVATSFGRFRMSSLCSEASTFGAFISAAFWAIMAMKKRLFHYILLVLVFIAMVLSMSGTAYVIFALGGFLYLYMNGVSFRYILPALIIGAFIYTTLEFVGYYSDIYMMLMEKSESSSGVVRYNTALMSLKIFFQSFGLGIGLGSTRSSSFLLDLLAQTGLIGTLLFFTLYKELIIELRKKRQCNWIFYFSIVLLFGQIIAEPDFSYSFFWMGLFMAACAYRYHSMPIAAKLYLLRTILKNVEGNH